MSAPQDRPPQPRLRRRNTVFLVSLLMVAFGMVGVAFAAVPLYDLFCRVTGFGGTTQVASGTTGEVLDRTVRVRFTADVSRDLPWRFAAEAREITVPIGASGFVAYSAENLSSTDLVGTAVYNVSPAKAGLYFNKVQCFCFDEQVLPGGQRVDLPVYFFVDPAMAEDPNLDDVDVITLSYTFYPARSGAFEAAMERYYADVSKASEDAEPSAQ